MSRTTDDAALGYIAETFAPEDALLQTIRAEGEARFPGMQISAAEGKLLFVLARLTGARRVLEIGSFVGYSTLWLARALPAAGYLLSLERHPEHHALAQRHLAQAALSCRVEIRLGAALESLEALARQELEPFDLVFIDAAKHEYAAYLDYIEPMVRPGGLIIGDNSLLFGAMYGEARQRTSPAAIAAMRAFNARLADAARYEAILLPTAEGLTVARKTEESAETAIKL